MSKYRYTVVSDEYVGAPTRLRKTGRIIRRAPQVLFSPDLVLFGMTPLDRTTIRALPVGFVHVDTHGDIWERIE